MIQNKLLKKYDHCALLGLAAFLLTFVAMTIFYAQSSLADEYTISPDTSQSISQ